MQGKIAKMRRNRLPGRPTIGNPQRIGADNGKAQAVLIFAHPVQGAAIGMGNGFGGQQNILSSKRSISRSLDKEAPIALSCSKRSSRLFWLSIQLLLSAAPVPAGTRERTA